MIPLHLEISGFLSYRDPASLDFESFDLACISGQNGAGKSSLLDAITWALFGEARGKSSEVIHLNPDVKAAEVSLIFKYENNVYRVQRTLPRGKTTVLEFQVMHGQDWKPLTERTMRETQARIEQTLRLDYETFINASFFLQGKADQFTQKNAGERKQILSNILGLGAWEGFRERTAAKRRGIERDLNELEGRLAEIDAELGEEDARRSRVNELETLLQELATTRASQETVLENLQRNAAMLDEQRKLRSTLSSGLDRARMALAGLETRLTARKSEREAYDDLLQRASQIESDHQQWQRARSELENWEKTATRFREQDRFRVPLLEGIAAEKARVEEEKRSLQLEAQAISDKHSQIRSLHEEINEAVRSRERAEEKIAGRNELEQRINEALQRQAALKVENEQFGQLGKELNTRIEKLEGAEGATCPLCGQDLTPSHRKSTLKQIKSERDGLREKYKTNQRETADLSKQLRDYEKSMDGFGPVEFDRMKYSSQVSQLTERLETLTASIQEWEKTGLKRLKEVEKILDKGKYAADQQKQLTKINKDLARLGYDAASHDLARTRESELRSSQEEFVNLKSAREAIRQMEAEGANLQSDIDTRKAEIINLESDLQAASTTLEAAEAQTPDLETAERELFRLREEENRIRSELGGARQRVEILTAQRSRKEELTKAGEEMRIQITRHKTLERAFSRDGLPALLIEQALPQIETRANDLLDRLSNGQMSIRFVTQAEYKSRKREDLKETLDIQISDAAGTRDYEMYSGGEAFRVNFAVRLALSEILAQRKGARLQTLVIDEGFGSQDAQGRQRLIEAINLIRQDFAKILVITHLDELKDAFPNRIEIEKTARGSTLHVN